MLLNLVTSKEEIIDTLIHFSNYQSNHNDDEFEYYKQTLKAGKNFVFANYEGKYIFCPSRFVGYKDCTIANHRKAINKNGSTTTSKITDILNQKNHKNNAAEQEFLQLCKKLNIIPDNKDRTYWKIDISTNIDTSYTGFPDEEGHPIEFEEGSVKKVVVNSYERNPKAREQCLKTHGYNCSVCDFNFENIYGEIGRGFIHVHHLKPISSIGKNYTLNPETDLRPVCPNCHSMLHKTNPPLSIEELKLRITLKNFKP